MTLDVRDRRSGSPRMGAVVGIGEPGATPMAVRVVVSLGVAGELLYRNVAMSTMEEPSTKATVIGYEKRATDARKDIIMDSEVAKPFLQVLISS